jgi:hypothetical protein
MHRAPKPGTARALRCGLVVVALTSVVAADPPLRSTPPASADPATPRPASCCPIVELRQYTTFPGQRDALIALFDREFVETQEATGMHILAQLRDHNDPNRFVWLRGFSDMPSRARALTGFYSGPVWKAHRKAANATMYDSSNVLLLRPSRDGAGFALADLRRPPRGASPGTTGFVVITIYYFARPVGDDFVRLFADTLRPLFARAGATILAELVSEHSENTFPALPVREGENAFVWIARHDSRQAYERHLARLAADPRWSRELFARLYGQLSRPPEVVMLEPTARSLIGRGGAR